MQQRCGVVARTAVGALVVAVLSACGGGSGSAGGTPVTPPLTPPPSVTTPAVGTVNVPGKQSSGGGGGGFVNDGKNLSTYSVTSNPPGLHFTLAAQSYTTNGSVTPAATTNALAIVFSSGYTVPIVQVYDGPHTVFYNALSDSQGTVAVSTLQSSLHRTAASMTAKHAALGAIRRPVVKHSGRNDIDPTRLAVRMSAAALLQSGRTPADVERAVGTTGRDTLSATTDRLLVVYVPVGTDAAALTAKLQAQPEVAEVTAVHRRFTQAQRQPTRVSDPDFEIPDQWYTFATGTNYAWSYNAGTGAKLAIIDTGIDDNNTDLTSQLGYQETVVTPIDNTPNAGNGKNPTCNTISGDSTVVTPNTAQDDDGHGTNVAGIAIAKENTAGFVGAAWGATLLDYKIFPNQNLYCNDALQNIGADTTDEGAAIADAIARGADVISLSIGADSLDTVEFNAIESAIAQGVTVVAAAGNSDDGSGPGTLDYPAAYPGVISVGASALRDQYYGQVQPNDGTYATSTEIVASYSQYGPSLSVVAPGGDASSETGDGDILHWIENYSTSTAYIPPNPNPSPECVTPSPATSCVVLFNGTSMATPQVSATAAMLIAEAGGHRRLTPAQVQYMIESTADNINDSKQGHGRLNSYRALASLIRDDTAVNEGPNPQKAGTAQLVAFAYTTGNTNKPTIIDATFPAGVPVATNGTFRIADVPVATGAFKVAVWYDANGDGYIDVGDQIGTASATCSSTSACAIGTITMQTVTSGYSLP